jgi:hypothetical protein
VQVDMLTEQIRDELATRLHAIPPTSCGTPGDQLPFIPASERLRIKRAEVRLRRSRSSQIYRHPGYFLNHRELTAVLRWLVETGLLTRRTLQRYSPSPTGSERLISLHSRRADFVGLGRLLTTNGAIEGSTLTGEELRAIIDERVGDGPTLRLAQPDELACALDIAVRAHAAQTTSDSAAKDPSLNARGRGVADPSLRSG